MMIHSALHIMLLLGAIGSDAKMENKAANSKQNNTGNINTSIGNIEFSGVELIALMDAIDRLKVALGAKFLQENAGNYTIQIRKNGSLIFIGFRPAKNIEQATSPITYVYGPDGKFLFNQTT